MFRRVVLAVAAVAAFGAMALSAACVEERVIYDGSVDTRLRQSMTPATPQAGWVGSGGAQSSSDGH